MTNIQDYIKGVPSSIPMAVNNIKNQNKYRANDSQSLADGTLQPTPETSYTQ